MFEVIQSQVIERIHAPDLASFYDCYVKRSVPVIIKGIVEEWPAYRKWSLEYIAQKYGDQPVGFMQVFDGHTDPDTFTEDSKKWVKLRDIISDLNKTPTKVVATPTSSFGDNFWKDIYLPPFCKKGMFLRSRIYIGASSVSTSLHQDLPENLYATVFGKKQIILFPPSDRKYLYPNHFFSRHPNFARFNPLQPDYHNFPLAKKSHPVEIILQAGEILFIPSLWWHYIRNLETSAAVNFWWNVGWKVLPAWGMAKIKKLING
ncbi:MAG: cupin-like domain-containing protein [Chitinophagales bacterium]|nr:cupin-like domain-containing protein [Chitinophagales bacterium]